MDHIAYEIRAARVGVPDPASYFRHITDLGEKRRAALLWARAAELGMAKTFKGAGNLSAAKEFSARAADSRRSYLDGLTREN